MAQTYNTIASTDTLSASRQVILDRDDAIKSSFSGTAFPTTNLLVGMLCYRTDLTKLYQLKDTTPTWIEIMDLSSSVGRSPNADTLDGYHASTTAVASTVPVYNASAQLVGSITGNAATATTWATARTIAITGDLTYTSGSLNGSANVTGTGTLANTAVTAGSYTAANITVDSKGRITAASSNTSLVTSFNTRTGAITLSSADVTGALGYTPVSNSSGSADALTMTGTPKVSSGAPTLQFYDSTTTRTRSVHHNEDLMGLLKTDGNWDMYVNNGGSIYSANYGWLHDFFFSGVGNCAPVRQSGNNCAGNAGNCVPETPINCYGSGNIVQTRVELLDNGSSVGLRSVYYNFNCNCNCACNC